MLNAAEKFLTLGFQRLCLIVIYRQWWAQCGLLHFVLWVFNLFQLALVLFYF